MATPEKQIDSFDAVIHMQESSLHKRFLVGLMQLTLHATRRTPHGVARLVLAMSAWSVKTRRAPSRHCRDARVYGHATTAMHHNEYPHPPASLPKKLNVSDRQFYQGNSRRF